jgi:predicted aspartyl protease
MAGRLYESSNCIEYEKSDSGSKPKINVRLTNVKLEDYPGVIPLSIDTGFDGSILVTDEVYRFFEIGELPKKYWRTYKSLVGPITMRVAKAIVSIEPGIRMETYVETPLFGFGKLLIGRELLDRLTIILDGPLGQLCVATLRPEH